MEQLLRNYIDKNYPFGTYPDYFTMSKMFGLSVVDILDIIYGETGDLFHDFQNNRHVLKTYIINDLYGHKIDYTGVLLSNGKLFKEDIIWRTFLNTKLHSLNEIKW